MAAHATSSRGPGTKAKGDAEKYRALAEPIGLIAVEFNKSGRNLAAFEVERA